MYVCVSVLVLGRVFPKVLFAAAGAAAARAVSAVCAVPFIKKTKGKNPPYATNHAFIISCVRDSLCVLV